VATLYESKKRIEQVLVEANVDWIADGMDYSKASVEQAEEA
jgi:hypothetical protein